MNPFGKVWILKGVMSGVGIISDGCKVVAGFRYVKAGAYIVHKPIYTGFLLQNFMGSPEMLSLDVTDLWHGHTIFLH